MKEELIPNPSKLFPKIKEKGTLTNSLRKACITLIPEAGKVTTMTKNYRLMSLMNMNAKILNKIIANQIQSTLREPYAMT